MKNKEYTFDKHDVQQYQDLLFNQFKESIDQFIKENYSDTNYFSYVHIMQETGNLLKYRKLAKTDSVYQALSSCYKHAKASIKQLDIEISKNKEFIDIRNKYDQQKKEIDSFKNKKYTLTYPIKRGFEVWVLNEKVEFCNNVEFFISSSYDEFFLNSLNKLKIFYHIMMILLMIGL